MTKKKAILSIDGGGIRGIIPAVVLGELEKHIQAIKPNTHLMDYIDLVAGTSTGGIIALGLTLPDVADDKPVAKSKFTIADLEKFYFDWGDEIFYANGLQKFKSLNGIWKKRYEAEVLEHCLNLYFGDRYLSDALKPTLITSYDVKRSEAKFFSSFKINECNHANFKIADVARATSAAPTYFTPAEITSKDNTLYRLIDGGMVANNPAMCAYAEARTIFNKPEFTSVFGAKDMLMISVGTGKLECSHASQGMNNWGAARWAPSIIDIQMDASGDTVNHQLEELFGTVKGEGYYYRFNKALNANTVKTELDCATRNNMLALKAFALEFTEEKELELKQLAALLTEN